jgi:hypothetical protein
LEFFWWQSLLAFYEVCRFNIDTIQQSAARA